MKYLGKVLTALRWLRNYDVDRFRGDLFAGLTVGVMVIPQSMAYAMLAGVPPIYGLYASLVPLLIYGLLGTSRHLAVGLDATNCVIVMAGVSAIATPESQEFIGLAIMLAVITGVFHLIMGTLRMGFLVNFLSRPVVAGFMSAVPWIIAGSQLGNLLGLDLSNTQYVYILLWETAEQIGQVHFPTLIMGVLGIAALVGLERWKPAAPSGLIVVSTGIAVTWFFGLDEMGVEIIGDIPEGLPPVEIPGFEFDKVQDLLPTALTMALIQFMAVMSLGKIFAKKHGYSISPNREFFAIGGANLIGSFFQSIPVSGSFSRSATNEHAGARTPMSNIITASLIAVTLLFLTSLFEYLPIPLLAAEIVVAAIGLVDIPEMRYLLKTKRRDGLVALLTFGVTLIVGIQEGLLTGVAASIIAILYRLSRPNVAELGHMPGTTDFRSLERNPDAETIEGIFILRVDASFSFANADLIKEQLLEASDEGEKTNALIVDASGVNDLDTTSAEMLADVMNDLAERDVEMYIAGAKGHVRDTIRRAGLHVEIGRDHFLPTPDLAVQAILTEWGEEQRYDQHEAHDENGDAHG